MFFKKKMNFYLVSKLISIYYTNKTYHIITFEFAKLKILIKFLYYKVNVLAK